MELGVLIVWILILAVLSGGVRAVPETWIPSPFKIVLYVVILIALIMVFATFLGIAPNLSLR